MFEKRKKKTGIKNENREKVFHTIHFYSYYVVWMHIAYNTHNNGIKKRLNCDS